MGGGNEAEIFIAILGGGKLPVYGETIFLF